jgi:hypothetical protein
VRPAQLAPPCPMLCAALFARTKRRWSFCCDSDKELEELSCGGGRKSAAAPFLTHLSTRVTHLSTRRTTIRYGWIVRKSCWQRWPPKRLPKMLQSGEEKEEECARGGGRNDGGLPARRSHFRQPYCGRYVKSQPSASAKSQQSASGTLGRSAVKQVYHKSKRDLVTQQKRLKRVLSVALGVTATPTLCMQTKFE